MDLDEQKVASVIGSDEQPLPRQVRIMKTDPRSALVRKFSSYTDVAAPHLESFNQFLDKAKNELINKTVLCLNNGHVISFSDAEIANPSMLVVDQSRAPVYPSYCLDNDSTYKGGVYTTATHYDSEKQMVVGKMRLHLHDLDIMTRSQACNVTQLNRSELAAVRFDKDDPGGYFVVDGAEKVIVMQERVAPNVLLSYQDPKDKVTANNPLASTINTEIKCVAPEGRKVKVSVRLMKKVDDDSGDSKRSNASAPVLKLVLPSFGEAEINVCAIFGVLSILNQSDPTFFQDTDNILSYVLDWVPREEQEIVANYLNYTLEAYSLYRTNPLGYIAEKLRINDRDRGLTPEQMREEIERQVRSNLFVNMADYFDPARPYQKNAEMVAWMVARHISVVTGLRGPRINPAEALGESNIDNLIRLGLDDRDDLSNKIIDTAGSLHMVLYSQAYQEQISKATTELNKCIEQPDLLKELSNLLRKSIVTDAMTRAIRTGDWGMPNKVKHKGLTRTLQRASIVGAVADVRSINAPIPRESKDVRPRSVHISTWGMICPTSTKEGEDCGLAKSLAQGANITTSSDPRLVRDLLTPGGRYADEEVIDARKSFLVHQKEDRYPNHDTPVFLNGAFLGFGVLEEVRGEVIASRREHAIPRQVSIRYDLDNTLQIHTEAGWLVRPLLVVDADQRLLVDKLNLWDADWGTVLQQGAAEYVTASEQGDLLIAVHPDQLGQEIMGADPNDPATYQESRDPTITHVPQYTHTELDPALIFSEEANTVPFPTHNPGTRPTYASNMAKHLVGVHHSAAQGIRATREIPAEGDRPAIPAQPAIPGRFESYKQLINPQRPLVTTDTYRRSEPELSARLLDELGKAALNKTDAEVEDIRRRLAEATNTDMFGVVGHMATVAILGGIPEAFDEEDAMMLNRGFVDRGGFLSTTYKAAEYEIENPDTEKLGIPPFLKAEDAPLYAAIDPATGVARVGSVLRPGMAIVAKYSEEVGREPRNTSIFLKSADHRTPAEPLKVQPFQKRGRTVVDPETGAKRFETREEYNARVANVRSVLSSSISNEPIVDDVLIGRSGAGKTFIKWKYRITRRPQVGDKFTSRFSQKGVAGMIFAPEDMPYSSITGVAPDVAVNRHGYITRMTIGQLLESLTGKAAALFGERLNATAFRDIDHAELRRVLESQGFSYSGGEPYINGMTGEMLEAMVFTGPVYMQVQKHLVEEKRHARALGDVHPIFHQPPEGRQKDGGLRLGEMERDALMAWGARGWLNERYMTVSDETTVHICPKCDQPMLANPQRKMYNCDICGHTEPVPPVKIPRSLLLLYGYNAAMGIKIGMKAGTANRPPALPRVEERKCDCGEASCEC